MNARHEVGIDPIPEFSRIVATDGIGTKEHSFVLEADANERSALAKRFDLIAFDGLSAQMSLSRCLARDGSGIVLRVVFNIDAAVVQRCVVSLDPVAARINEIGLVVEFRPSGVQEPEAEVDFAAEAVDSPEIMIDERIDLGELVAEHLALALDPYPRAEGAASEIADLPSDSDTIEEDEHPFAALRGWRKGAKPGKG